jgi:hypothetical protein
MTLVDIQPLSGLWVLIRRARAPDTIHKSGALIMLDVPLSIYDLVRLVKAVDLVTALAQETHPVKVRVLELGYIEGDTPLLVLGECSIGLLDIYLSPRLFSTYRMGTDQFMPVIKRRDVSALLYVLAHEFGHGRDTRPPGMSSWERGRCHFPIIGSNGRETYAEAWTEWYLSRGQTTNDATRWYAERNSWRKVF